MSGDESGIIMIWIHVLNVFVSEPGECKWWSMPRVPVSGWSCYLLSALLSYMSSWHPRHASAGTVLPWMPPRWDTRVCVQVGRGLWGTRGLSRALNTSLNGVEIIIIIFFFSSPRVLKSKVISCNSINKPNRDVSVNYHQKVNTRLSQKWSTLRLY